MDFKGTGDWLRYPLVGGVGMLGALVVNPDLLRELVKYMGAQPKL